MSLFDSLSSWVRSKPSTVNLPSGYSDMMTPAPVEWLEQVQTQPGYVALPTDPTLTKGQGMFGGLFDNFFDTTNADGIKTQGWGGLALSGLQGLGNSYMGMKQYGLAEDALKEQKRQFNINYEAQRKMTNAQLSDRQRARVASNPGAYTSEAEYMKQWGI